MTKKFVVRLELMEDQQDKRRALKTVSTLSGIDEITIDVKGKKLTVVGTVDPVSVVSKLRKKNWTADIISVGPAKVEEPKKEAAEPKKEEAKKEGEGDEAKKKEQAEQPKKEEEGGAGNKNKEEEQPAAAKKEPEANKEAAAHQVIKMVEPQYVYGAAMPYHRPYNYPPPSYYYVRHHSMEENPNACAIC